MCGIVGYVGPREAAPVLVEGLGRLEYRGYDSAGVAVLNGGGVETRKLAGRIARLRGLLVEAPVHGSCGIGHTRWATHGAPTERNAHPHSDCSGTLALVHNGIIENADVLRTRLEREGHRFTTETDTETLAHLIEDSVGETLEERVMAALAHVEGTYGIAVVCEADPGKIVVARRGSPVLLGVGDGEFLVASDASAVLAHTRSVVYLNDGDVAVVTRSGYRVLDSHAQEQDRGVDDIEWDLDAIALGGYPHFMLKEICEQAETVRSTLRGRLLAGEGTARLNGLNLTPAQCSRIRRIVIVACGTSWHAGLVGRHVLEELGEIPVSVEYASEYRYRRELRIPGTLTIAISQSGETADTLAERYAEARNALYLGRGVNFPVALEGALKLKEISYIHAEGYPAAEMKHGPIALIDENMPVVCLAPKDSVYAKVVSNMQEVKARGGRIIAITSEGNGDLGRLVDHQIAVPASSPLLAPVLTVIPLQLLAYHIAVLRGQVETYLTQQLKRYMKDPVVHAKVLVRLSILGEVEHPGFYPVRADAPVSDALMAAGGPTKDAKFTGTHIDRIGRDGVEGSGLPEAVPA